MEGAPVKEWRLVRWTLQMSCWLLLKGGRNVAFGDGLSILRYLEDIEVVCISLL